MKPRDYYWFCFRQKNKNKNDKYKFTREEDIMLGNEEIPTKTYCGWVTGKQEMRVLHCNSIDITMKLLMV